jgi:hypothetical protein
MVGKPAGRWFKSSYSGVNGNCVEGDDGPWAFP